GQFQSVPTGQREVRLPDLHLSRGQTISGIVVDPKGKPLPGIHVGARLNGQSVARRESHSPPWTETNEQGRFELRELPDEPVELFVYKRKPKDPAIKNSTKVKTAMNQKEVRVLFDPALGEDIEDLDAPKPPAKKDAN